jgi:hypothetical protein
MRTPDLVDPVDDLLPALDILALALQRRHGLHPHILHATHRVQCVQLFASVLHVAPPLRSTVSEDARINPCTVATSALALRPLG